MRKGVCHFPIVLETLAFLSVLHCGLRVFDWVFKLIVHLKAGVLNWSEMEGTPSGAKLKATKKTLIGTLYIFTCILSFHDWSLEGVFTNQLTTARGRQGSAKMISKGSGFAEKSAAHYTIFYMPNVLNSKFIFANFGYA